MKKLLTLLLVFTTFNCFSQTNTDFSKMLLNRFFENEQISDALKRAFNTDEYILIDADSTPYYQSGYTDNPLIMTNLRDIEELEAPKCGFYKIEVVLNENIKINSTILYKEDKDEVYIEDIFIREKMWFLPKRKVYTWEISM